jgi:hypothetical protein
LARIHVPKPPLLAGAKVVAWDNESVLIKCTNKQLTQCAVHMP